MMNANQWIAMIDRVYDRITRNPERPPDEDLETHAALARSTSGPNCIRGCPGPRLTRSA